MGLVEYDISRALECLVLEKVQRTALGRKILKLVRSN